MNSFFQRYSWIVCSVVVLQALLGCSASDEAVTGSGDVESVGTVTQALDTAHTRVIQECSQAMVGNHDTYNATNWPTATTYSTYAYISNDLGAWGKLLDNTYDTSGTIRGWWTSCRSTTSTQNYTPCSLTAYGDLDAAASYDCQGTCTSGINHRGGQCKPFMNLVAYRSGLYQLSGFNWKAFPSDSCIANTWATCNLQNPAQRVPRPVNDQDFPVATYNLITEGDYLRKPNDHAVIVVRKFSSTTVVVLDSNYLNGGSGSGNGKEIIGSHALGFNGVGDHTDLGAYRVLKCAYTGAC